jgi:putative thioredoxin
MAYEVTDFQSDVLEASRKTPVLVDFWAPWCGPCRVLGPTLEKLADEAGDAWTLVKVNSDQHQDLARRYGVRGIPNVKLFSDGEVIDEFTGALPEHAVKQWLEKALPNENRQRIDQAQTMIEAGETEQARALLEDVLAAEPNTPQAKILLAQLLVFDDPERATTLAEGAAFAGPRFVQIEEAVQTLARLMQLAPDDLPDEDGKRVYVAAINALQQHDLDAALEHFIEVIRTNRYYDDDGARKACIALFTLLGPQHETTRRYRRTFDMALY